MNIIAMQEYSLTASKEILFIKVKDLDQGTLHTPNLQYDNDKTVRFAVNWNIPNARVQIFTT